jgi:hypothetical protein
MSTLIVGAVLLLNEWFFKYNPWLVVSVILIVAGIISIAKPSCGCDDCGSCCEAPAKPKAKKK